MFQRLCKTSVEKDTGGFRNCDKPATEMVTVGMQQCYYCREHAIKAREYVAKKGDADIALLQKKFIKV